MDWQAVVVSRRVNMDPLPTVTHAIKKWTLCRPLRMQIAMDHLPIVEYGTAHGREIMRHA